MKKQAEETNKLHVTTVSFSGVYYMAIGFLWQFIWQISKVVDYATWFHISDNTFYWLQIGLVSACTSYLAGHMIFLETKRGISSLGLLVKYVIGLVLGYLLGQFWL